MSRRPASLSIQTLSLLFALACQPGGEGPPPPPGAHSQVRLRASRGSSAKCNLSAAVEWSPVRLNPSPPPATTTAAVRVPEATAPDPFTSWDEQATREGDVVACDYTSETPGLLAPGQWRISWLSPVAGVIAQCEVKLNEGENWSGFSLGVAGCVTNPLGFLFPDS